MVELVSELIPEGTQVVFLGDGEFDGTRLQYTVQGAGWSYVCRTGCHRTAWWDGKTFRLDTLGVCSKPGTLVALSQVLFTRAKYGPLIPTATLECITKFAPAKWRFCRGQ